MNQRQMNLQLNMERMEQLYKNLRQALQHHVGVHPGKNTPSLVYEALDALALVTSEIWAGLENGVGEQAAKTSKRYFKDRANFYTNSLKKDKNQIRTDEPPKPTMQ